MSLCEPNRVRALRLGLGLSLIGLVFLSMFGCVDFYVRQQFYPNGRSTVLEQIPLASPLAKLNHTMTLPPAPYDQRPAGWLGFIDAQCAAAGSYEPGATCHRSGDWLVIDQERVPGPEYAFVSYNEFPYRVYELNVSAIPGPPAPNLTSFNVGYIPLERNLTHADKDNVLKLRALGVNYYYTIIMPGDIVNYSTGHLSDQGLEVNGIEQLYSRQPIFVQSKELDTGQLALIVVFPLLILLFLDFVAILGYKEWKKRRDQSEVRRRAREEEELKSRVFRKNPKLKSNQVYIAEDAPEGTSPDQDAP
ncbi:MAG: hypothetical protein V1728_03335 [Candidatus Micrarchaeota archaeon]